MINSAVLLAAGRGKRLRPATDVTPKPLLKVRGRATLDYVLCALKVAGIERVCIVTHHLEKQIIDFVGDGSKWDLEIICVHQNELLGSGDALGSTPQDWIRHEPVMVVATDYALEETSLLELVQAYQKYDSDIIIGLKESPVNELTRSSSVDVGEDWQVNRLIEKPKYEEILSPFAALFLFILPVQIWDFLAELTPSPRGEIELQAAVNRMIGDGFRAYGVLQPAPIEWDSTFESFPHQLLI